MCDEAKFIIFILIAAACIALAITTNIQMTNTKILKAIESGSDPIMARCAFTSDEIEVCVLMDKKL